jgi:hypothetical protein
LTFNQGIQVQILVGVLRFNIKGEFLMQKVLLISIPEQIILSDIKVNPRQRLLDFIKGSGQPSETEVWLHDVMSWLNWEESWELRNIILASYNLAIV